MPKTILQNIIFTIAMAFVMVYAMVCYNIAMEMNGLTNETFLIAFKEMPIMWPIASVLEFFVVERLSKKLAFRFVNPKKDSPIMITLGISSMIVCLMCPIMSFVATILFKHPGTEIISVWIETTIKNFPMALMWQIFFAGPIIRNIFNVIFKNTDM